MLNTQRLIGSSQAVFVHITYCIVCKRKYTGICVTGETGTKIIIVSNIIILFTYSDRALEIVLVASLTPGKNIALLYIKHIESKKKTWGNEGREAERERETATKKTKNN